MSAIAERLRDAAAELRRKPIPLKDFIPLLQQAADALDVYRERDDMLRAIGAAHMPTTRVVVDEHTGEASLVTDPPKLFIRHAGS